MICNLNIYNYVKAKMHLYRRMINYSKLLKALRTVSNQLYRNSSTRENYIPGKMLTFFKNETQILEIIKLFPPQHVKTKINTRIEYLYLINPDVAKSIAKHISSILNQKKEHFVAETNPGIGLLTKELLNGGIKLLRLYESCSDMRAHLMVSEYKYTSCYHSP